MNKQHIQEKIEMYIRGELSANQIDLLWIEFLKDPDWYDYFITYLHLVVISRSKSALRERKN